VINKGKVNKLARHFSVQILVPVSFLSANAEIAITNRVMSAINAWKMSAPFKR
jgi:hypothetical protein